MFRSVYTSCTKCCMSSVCASVVRHASRTHPATATEPLEPRPPQAPHLRAWRHLQLRHPTQTQARLPEGSPQSGQDHRSVDRRWWHPFRSVELCLIFVVSSLRTAISVWFCESSWQPSRDINSPPLTFFAAVAIATGTGCCNYASDETTIKTVVSVMLTSSTIRWRRIRPFVFRYHAMLSVRCDLTNHQSSFSHYFNLISTIEVCQ